MALLLLFAVRPLTLPVFLVAAAVAGVYFVTMIFAPLFPGTAWIDPEFAKYVPKRFGLNPQQFVTYVLCTVLVLAVAIACLWGA